MFEVELKACSPEPLMSYLKALGVFRLIAEQADPNAALSWRGGVAHLMSSLDRDGLLKFFLEDYRPTPILAPWNGGSGFYGGGREPLDAISNSTSTRLRLYRETISRVREFLPSAKPKDDEKDSLLMACRNLPDAVVPWLDVCFVLSEDGASFFPLLGTGGNDGRLDFTNNFMQRMGDVVPFDERPQADRAAEYLSSALFGDGVVSLGKAAIGQFNPGGIGGPNGTQGRFEGESRVNPWEFVLMIEGALLFAGSIARRLGTHTSSRSVFPFSVESVAVGYGSATASEETTDGSRSELWLPLWDEGCTLPEVRHLFAEGRAQFGRRQARNAVEFVLAVNLLGVDRGIKSFARYGFLKRNGLAFLATPLGRTAVTLRPQARLLNDSSLVEWLDRLHRACSDKDKTPMRYQSALRQIDRAMFAFGNRSEQGPDNKYLLDVLIAIGRAEKVLSRGIAFSKGKYPRPLQGLSPQWIEQANDGSREFRLACSLAGISATPNRRIGPLRQFLEEIEMKGSFPDWSPGNTSAVWSRRPLTANLAAVFQRRQMEAFRSGLPGVPLHSAHNAQLDDILAFMNEETNDEKLEDVLWGLITVRFPAQASAPAHGDVDIPFEFGVARLVVNENSFVASGKYWNWTNGAANAKPDAGVFQTLASGRRDAVETSVTLATRRLRSGGLVVNGYRNRQHVGTNVAVVSRIRPERLLAAMLFPLSNNDLAKIATAVLYPPEREE